MHKKITPKNPILFVDILTPDPKKRRVIERAEYHGHSYGEEIRRVLGLSKNTLKTVDGIYETLPSPRGYRAIIIGGSTSNPVKKEEQPWMYKIYRFIRAAHRARIPMLGICGGLQFAVRALGGTIVYNPKGRNFGTQITRLSARGARDLIFQGMPTAFPVQSSHLCIVKTLPKGARILASSPKSPVDAVAIRSHIRLVQFHPEMSRHAMQGIARMRQQTLINEGYVSANAFPTFYASLKDASKSGNTILQNFLRFFVKKDYGAR